MKVFAVAFGIACGMAVVLFYVTFAVLTFFQRPEAVAAAASVGTLTIGSFKAIAEFLERENSRKNLAAGAPNPIYDFHGFQIAWPLMVVYGTIMLLVIIETGEFIAGFVNGALGAQNSTPGFLIAALLTWIPGSYLTGQWVGTRCAQWGVFAMLLLAALTAGSLTASAVFAAIFEWVPVEIRQSVDMQHVVVSFVIKMFIFLVVGLFGYWRGQRHRLSKYLHYLLQVLPAETREAVVELAFGEAQKVASRRGPTNGR